MDAHLELRRPTGTELIRLEGESVTLGRAETNTLSFGADATVSQRHAVIERVDGDWRLSDAGSTNGTRINGDALQGPVVLRSGDEIAIGTQMVTFRADGEARAAGEAAAAAAGYLDVSEEWSGFRDPAAESAATARPAAARPSRSSSPSRPAAQPAQRRVTGRGSAQVVGVARSIQIRTSQERQDVMTFRVHRYDAAGNQLPPVSVEFAGYSSGQIGEDDEVQVKGKWSRGTLRARHVTNLSTGSQLRGPSKVMVAISVLVVLLVLAFIVGIAVAGILGS